MLEVEIFSFLFFYKMWELLVVKQLTFQRCIGTEGFLWRCEGYRIMMTLFVIRIQPLKLVYK